MQGKDWQPGDEEPVLDVFNRTLAGVATDQERERIMRELQNPNSSLHDYLEQFAAWAQKAFDKPDRHADAGDAMLKEGAARNDRSRIVRFVMDKKSAGVMGGDKISAILTAGRIEESKLDELGETELRQANEAMIAAISKEYPELSGEAESLRWPNHKRGGTDGGRQP